jgi:dCTP deaminase
MERAGGRTPTQQATAWFGVSVKKYIIVNFSIVEVRRFRTVGILGRDKLRELIDNYRCIYPYDYTLLDGDGYILTVKEETTVQYLEHRNLVSYEVVFTPPNLVAHLTAKSKYGRMGLSFLNAAKIHSGFIGRIVLEVVNLSNDRKPITIKHGDPFMHTEFITRDGEPSPYMGEFQFQFLTDEEIRMYIPILKKVFPNYEELAKVWFKNKRLTT